MYKNYKRKTSKKTKNIHVKEPTERKKRKWNKMKTVFKILHKDYINLF